MKVKELLPSKLIKDDLLRLMKLKEEEDLNKLYNQAYQVKAEHVGRKVYYRGIIEFSNYCQKNCYYCGIRKDNSQVTRFMMKEQEILNRAEWVYKNDYGSLVLQSGECQSQEYIEFVEKIVTKIKELSSGELGITLSLGEQSKETYRRWFAAGAHRYLLRIETANPKLYQKLHPDDHKFTSRLSCLQDLKEIGYQVGTGVMIGLPGQTVEDIVDDLLFFQEYDIDMIGMGPYVVHDNTPLKKEIEDIDHLRQRNLEWGIKMVALLRLLMPDVNIAATTALQALDPQGREKALAAGANVLMPIVTHQKYRQNYQLYDNKPCIDEKATDCQHCLAARVKSVGDQIGYGEWGDPPHYFNRIGDLEQELGREINAENAAGQ